jgi:hypothetical protein
MSGLEELVYKTPDGKVANQLLYRHDEPRIEVVEQGRPWSFDGDGARFRLAHLFDPVLAVHTSVVDPLPHQITAVYGAVLPRQRPLVLGSDDVVRIRDTVRIMIDLNERLRSVDEAVMER